MSAALNFLWVAGAGLAMGVAVTLAVTRVKAWVTKRWGEDTGSQVLVSLLIPFGSYLLAEHRSEEHTSELQSLMRTSYAVFCLKKKTTPTATALHKRCAA